MNRSRASISVLLGAGALLVATGCSHCPAPAPSPPPRQVVCVAPPPPPAPTAAVAPAPASLNPDTTIVVKDVGLQTPECVLWDIEQDVYLVSNINGKPTAVDGNGFISKVGPDGKVVDLKWIDGTKKGSELNAPKGMAVAGKLLFVADLDTIRKFDRKTGKPKGKIDIKGATYLNALAVSPDGKTLYASDSSVKIDDNGFSSVGADAIYEIDIRKKSVKPLIQDRTLHWPNGVLADETGVWVVSLAKNELIHVNYKGEMGAVTKLPAGSLDGIVRLPDKTFLISSWEAQAVYRGLPGGEFTEVISGVPSPAAIGLDSKRSSVLIPNFGGNAVEIHKLPVLPVLEETSPQIAASKESPKAPGATEVPAPPPPPSPASRAHAPTPAPTPAYAPAPAPAPVPAPAPAAAPALAPAAAPAPAPTPSAGPRPTKWE